MRGSSAISASVRARLSSGEPSLKMTISISSAMRSAAATARAWNSTMAAAER